MQLFIRNALPKTVIIDAHMYLSIHDIKKIIEAKTTLPVRYQHLLFQGKILCPTRTITQCGIKQHDTLHIVLRR